MVTRRSLRLATRTFAIALALLAVLYGLSFRYSIARISLAGTSVRLYQGRVDAHWLRTPTPWTRSIPAPGWHLSAGPQRLSFSGAGTALYGMRDVNLRFEYALAPLALITWGLWYLTRRLRPAGSCPACGYDQSGLPPKAPCPECGRTRLLARFLALRPLRPRPHPAMS